MSQYLTLYTDIYEALNTCKQDGDILQWNIRDIFLQGLPQNMVLKRIFEFKLYSYRVLYWQLLLASLKKKKKKERKKREIGFLILGTILSSFKSF